jgi:hypothetical protein
VEGCAAVSHAVRERLDGHCPYLSLPDGFRRCGNIALPRAARIRRERSTMAGAGERGGKLENLMHHTHLIESLGPVTTCGLPLGLPAPIPGRMADDQRLRRSDHADAIRY